MANRRLQCRQLFWRNGWSTASEREGRAPTGQPARTVAQQRGPARSVGARGGHEGPASTGPGPHPTSESAPTLSEPAVACEHERRSAHARAREMSPPAASSARRAHSQSPAQTLTRRRSASSVAQRRARSSTAIRSHVRQIERSTWQTRQVRRRRGRHTRPQSRQARRCFVRQSPRRFRPLPRTPSRGSPPRFADSLMRPRFSPICTREISSTLCCSGECLLLLQKRSTIVSVW